MDEATKNKLFEDLGSIKAELKSINENNKAQWDKMEKQDARVRTLEIKSAGIASVFAIGISLITKGFGGTT